MEKPRNEKYEAVTSLTPEQESAADAFLAGSELESVSLSSGEKKDWGDQYNIREVNHTIVPGLVNNKIFEATDGMANNIMESTPEENAALIKTAGGEKIESLSKLDIDLSTAKVEQSENDNFLKRVGRLFGM